MYWFGTGLGLVWDWFGGIYWFVTGLVVQAVPDASQIKPHAVTVTSILHAAAVITHAHPAQHPRPCFHSLPRSSSSMVSRLSAAGDGRPCSGASSEAMLTDLNMSKHGTASHIAKLEGIASAPSSSRVASCQKAS